MPPQPVDLSYDVYPHKQHDREQHQRKHVVALSLAVHFIQAAHRVLQARSCPLHRFSLMRGTHTEREVVGD